VAMIKNNLDELEGNAGDSLGTASIPSMLVQTPQFELDKDNSFKKPDDDDQDEEDEQEPEPEIPVPLKKWSGKMESLSIEVSGFKIELHSMVCSIPELFKIVKRSEKLFREARSQLKGGQSKSFFG